jgi:hypothetical protein
MRIVTAAALFICMLAIASGPVLAQGMDEGTPNGGDRLFPGSRGDIDQEGEQPPPPLFGIGIAPGGEAEGFGTDSQGSLTIERPGR